MKDKVEVSYEVVAGEDHCSFDLLIRSEEPMSYEEFLSAVRIFCEAEELSPTSSH